MNGFIDSIIVLSSGALLASLNMLGHAVALALAAWLALKFAPRINAATRYAVWWAVLAIELVLPFVPRWNTAPRVVTATLATQQIASTATISTQAEDLVPGSADVSGAATSAPVEVHSGAWVLALFGIWSLVFLFRVGQVLWSYRYISGVKLRAVPAARELRMNFDMWMMACHVKRGARLLVSDEIATPMAVGFLQPAVILPQNLLAELTGEEVDHIVLHEVAHLARFDDWANLAAKLASAALVLHPVVAWVLRRIEREREIACDDWVVAATGAARPYAASLARIFELCSVRRRELLAAAMAGRGSQLGERIEKLLQNGRDFAPRASMARVAIGVVLLLLFALAASQTPQWIAFAQEPVAPAAPAEAIPETAPAPPAPPAIASTPISAAGAPRAATTPRAVAALQAPAAPQAVPPRAVAQPAAPARADRLGGSLLAALNAAGYGDLSVDEIIDLKVNGVSADFIRGINQSGWGKLTAKQLVDLRVNGVDPAYVRDMREAGVKDVTLADVKNLRVNGARPDHVREIHSLGFGPYTAKQIIDFAVNGVRPDLFRALKDAGFANVEARDIIDARIHGLSAGNLREAKSYGPNLTLKQIIRLKQAGVI